MDIACSTITWNQFRNQPDSPYAGTGGYERILDEVRQAGYSHVVAGGGRRRSEASPADRTATPEGQLALLREHGPQPAPGYYRGKAESCGATQGRLVLKAACERGFDGAPLP